jgi:hypothetical protein
MYAHTGERSENVNDHSSNNSARRSGRRTWASRLLFIVGVAGAAFLGASTHEAAAQNAVSQIDTARYSVAVSAIPLTRTRQYQATQTGSATFTVKSKLPYTVDRNHTWTLTLHNPPDYKVAFAKNVYNRSDAVLTDSSVTFSVPFLTVTAGRGTIEGVVDVRVCSTDGRCDTKSEQVALAIEITPAPAL